MSDARPFPWRTLLFVSVALNLLLVGAGLGALGAGVRVEREAPAETLARMPGPRAFINALPEDARRPVRQSLVRSWAQSRDARRAAAEARRDVYEAAMAEPFDAERVRLAFARMRAADQAALGVFHDNVVDVFAELTPAQRRAALEALRRGPRGGDAALDADAAAPAEDAGAPAQQLTPADRQQMREQAREAIRERMRERLRERQQQQQQQQQ